MSVLQALPKVRSGWFRSFEMGCVRQGVVVRLGVLDVGGGGGGASSVVP